METRTIPDTVQADTEQTDTGIPLCTSTTVEAKAPRIQVEVELDESADAKDPGTNWNMTIIMKISHTTNRWHFTCPGESSREKWDAVVEGEDGAHVFARPGNCIGEIMVRGEMVTFAAMQSDFCDSMDSECTFPHEWLATPLRAALAKADVEGYKFEERG